MLTTSAMSGKAFDRVVNGSKPTLKHPTAKAFDPKPWHEILESAGYSDRDRSLATAAIFCGDQIGSLRTHAVEKALAALSRRSAIRLALAQANRNFAVIRRRMKAALDRKKGRQVSHLSHLSRTIIGGAGSQPELNADDLTTAVVDTLPHWFAQALGLADDREALAANFREIGARADAALSIEHGYRDLWQQSLWEGWHFDFADGKAVFKPTDQDDALLWNAWVLRQEALSAAPGIIASVGNTKPPSKERRTITNVAWRKGGLRLRLGVASKNQRESAEFDVSAIKSSYLRAFLDLPLSDTNAALTPRVLVEIWHIIRDLTVLYLEYVRISEINCYSDVQQLSLAIDKNILVKSVSDALGLNTEDAAAALQLLTTDTTDMSALFSRGMWHRPLVLFDDATLLLCAPAIVVGSPIRRVELWLQDQGVGERLTKSPPGIIFERGVRARIEDSLVSNEMIDNFSSAPDGIPKKSAGDEEVDALFRVGNRIFLGEVKCFLMPTEPMEHYNYIRKLEDAAGQAERKIEWLKNRPDICAKYLGIDVNQTENYSFSSLVILNQASGSSLKIGNTVCIDAHFLGIYLGNSSYRSGGAIDYSNGEIIYAHTDLYGSEQEAADAMMKCFASLPGLQPFIKATGWTSIGFPTSSGKSLAVAAPFLQAEGLMQPDELATAQSLLDKI